MKQIALILKQDMKIVVLTSRFCLAGGDYKKLTKFLKSLSIHPKIPLASDSYAYRAASKVWQTFDIEEQVNKRTEERV